MPVNDPFQNHPAWRTDKRLAELLKGDYGLGGLSREGKVVSLANLKVLFDAVLSTGWHTNTGDSDWHVEVYLVDGTMYQNENTCWRWPEELKMDTACVQYEQADTVLFWASDDIEQTERPEEREVILNIDDIVCVRFEEE